MKMEFENKIHPGYWGKPVNPRLIKEQKLGGKSFSYIEATTTLDLLDHAFGGQWSFEIVETRVDDLGPIDIVFTVVGKMTIPGLGTRMSIASTSFVQKCTKNNAREALATLKDWRKLPPRNIIYDNIPDIWKVAATDCLKKLASWFGIAKDVYGFKDILLTKENPVILVFQHYA